MSARIGRGRLRGRFAECGVFRIETLKHVLLIGLKQPCPHLFKCGHGKTLDKKNLRDIAPPFGMGYSESSKGNRDFPHPQEYRN